MAESQMEVSHQSRDNMQDIHKAPYSSTISKFSLFVENSVFKSLY